LPQMCCCCFFHISSVSSVSGIWHLNCNFRGASTLRSVVTRRAREPLSSKLMINLFVTPKLSARIYH
jgi:hypothetical protein